MILPRRCSTNRTRIKGFFVVVAVITGCMSSMFCSAFFIPSIGTKQKQQHQQTCLFVASSSSLTDDDNDSSTDRETAEKGTCDKFDLDLALFCGGLAFDAYVEPPADSSRWERGSKGMNVAFVSSAFTKNLYKGMVEVTPIQCAGLPEEDDGVERALSGGGVDACILVAAIEGQWKEDIELLKQGYSEGILDLSGAAHVGRSTTAWSNVNLNKSNAEKKKTGKAPAYHIPKSWGKDASAIWPEEEPFYIYVQDPEKVKLLFTLFDDDVIGEGSPIGSTYISLVDVLPQVKFSQKELIDQIKADILMKIQRGQIEADKVEEEISKAVNKEIQAWEGDLKLTSKPRIKNKNNQVAMGVAAGAMVAGPIGAAVGATLGSLYEGQVKGRIKTKLRYLPIPQAAATRNRYNVLGGMPGINWGDLYRKYLTQRINFSGEQEDLESTNIAGKDLEFCFFINHDETGGCCAVYRSLEKKLIVISFRGTCQPVDLITDASIVQEPWVEGEDPKKEGIAKVHVGFRKSMNSISRRLKELVLATVGSGENISDYDMLVTGHSLGGALATLFIADIGEYGIDAGRALPQTDASDAWWKALTNAISGSAAAMKNFSEEPPRPKSLKLYNFGSPRVGNKAFAERFDKLVGEGRIDQAYRIVNDNDVVARAPRTMVTLSVDYDHCGSTVLVEEPADGNSSKVLWIEGESDDKACPVRDYENRVANPTSEGTLLGDLLALTKEDSDNNKDAEQVPNQLGNLASKFGERLSKATASDFASIIGIDKNFSEREIKIVQSLVKGDALAHHMEDSYYAAMGRAVGFRAQVGEEISQVERFDV